MIVSWWKPDPAGPFKRTPTPCVEFRCFHCDKTTRVLTQVIADAEAEHWKKRHDTVIAMWNDMLERCAREHGDDAVRLWMLRDLIKLRESFDTEGEEWKRRSNP